jgi:hypothetical protein
MCAFRAQVTRLLVPQVYGLVYGIGRGIGNGPDGSHRLRGWDSDVPKGALFDISQPEQRLYLLPRSTPVLTLICAFQPQNQENSEIYNHYIFSRSLIMSTPVASMLQNSSSYNLMDPCSICFEPITEAAILLPCRHAFDIECVDRAFRATQSEIKACPMCRGVVRVFEIPGGENLWKSIATKRIVGRRGDDLDRCLELEPMANAVEVQPQVEPDWENVNLGSRQAIQGLSGGEPSEPSTLHPISVADRNRASLRLPHGRLINRPNPVPRPVLTRRQGFIYSQELYSRSNTNDMSTIYVHREVVLYRSAYIAVQTAVYNQYSQVLAERTVDIQQPLRRSTRGFVAMIRTTRWLG